MIYKYNKHQILAPLECGAPHYVNEFKKMTLDQISSGNQVVITSQIEGYPIEKIDILKTIQEVNSWFERLGL